MMNKTATFTFLVLTGFAPAAALAELTLSQPTRDANDLDLLPSLPDESDPPTLRINRQDCLQNLEIGFVIDETSTDVDGELYLVVGEDCRTDLDDESCIYLKIPTPVFSRRVHDLLSTEEAERCDVEDKRKIWVARIEDPDDREGAGEEWSDPVTLSIDMEVPDPPAGIAARPGENKVEVSWMAEGESDAGATEAVLDSDVDRIIVMYEEVGATASARESDNASEVDTGTTADTGAPDSEADAGAIDSDAGAIDSDTGADNLVSVIVRALTAAEACEGDGDLEAGAGYTPTESEKTTTGVYQGSTVVSGLTNGATYRFSVVALDDHGNPSLLSEVVCATPGEVEDAFERYAEAGGKSGDFCFVATAAFGSFDHPVVRQLRSFRDSFILNIPGGGLVIDAYYRIGPDAAAFIEGRPLLKGVAQAALGLIAGITAPLGLLGPLGLLALALGFIISGMAISRRRRT